MERRRSEMTRRAAISGALASILTPRVRAESVERLNHFGIQPEWSESLETILVSASDSDTPEVFNRRYHDLLRILPRDTRIAVAYDDSPNMQALVKCIGESHATRGGAWLPIPVKGLEDEWPRDWGVSGRATFIIPSPHAWNATTTTRVAHRAAIGEHVAHMLDMKLERAPFPFDGGNIRIDTDAHGNTRLLVGFDVLCPRHEEPLPTPNEIRARLDRMTTFFGMPIFVMGTTTQDEAVYHLDLSFIPLPPGKKGELRAALVWPDSPCATNPDFSEFVHEQERTERRLRELGYTTIARIPHTATEVREHMSSVNAIMFSRDNQTHLVLPVYPHQVHADTPNEPLDPNTLVGTARTAYDTFSSLGIVVTPVRDPGESDSGLHCKTNQFTR